MATHTRPFLMTGAALASAAAVVVATPQLMPSVAAPSPIRLSQAQFENTDFATFLTLLNPQDISFAFFSGWGGALGPGVDPTPPDDPGLPVSNQYAPFCDYDCIVPGLSGISYMLLDGLINGSNGNIDPAVTSAVNNFYEGGFSAGSQYLAQSAFGQANPILSTLISFAFLGDYAVTVVFDQILGTAASLVSAIPVIGPFIAGGIDAYLGGYDGSANGLSGVLAYTIDTIGAFINGILPGAAVAPGAATLAVAPAAASVSRALRSAQPKAEATSAPAAPAAADKTEVTVTDASATETKATETKADDTKVEVAADTDTADAPKADTTESAPKVDTPAAGDTSTASDSAPAADAPAPKPQHRRPVRDAVEKVTAGISNALKGAARGGAATAGAGAAGSGNDAG